MKVNRLLSLSFLATFCALPALAGDQSFDDIFGYYFHRTDTISMSAGDAKNVNAMSQMIDPWPPQVRDRRIPVNGARMSATIRRYEDVRLLKEAAPTLSPDAIKATGVGGTQGSSR